MAVSPRERCIGLHLDLERGETRSGPICDASHVAPRAVRLLDGLCSSVGPEPERVAWQWSISVANSRSGTYRGVGTPGRRRGGEFRSGGSSRARMIPGMRGYLSQAQLQQADRLIPVGAAVRPLLRTGVKKSPPGDLADPPSCFSTILVRARRATLLGRSLACRRVIPFGCSSSTRANLPTSICAPPVNRLMVAVCSLP